jgi:hypothetical protein
LLGLVDLYMNLRATRLMAVQVFVPVAFVWHVSLQYLQSIALFAELRDLDTSKAALSIFGACLSLVGALCIQLPTLDRSEVRQSKSDDPSTCGVDLEDCSGKTRIFLECAQSKVES